MSKELKGVTFSQYVEDKSVSPELASVFADLVVAGKQIFGALQKGIEGQGGQLNATGDEQVGMDVLSNEILVKLLKDNDAIGYVGSEELEEPMETGKDGLSVVFDPLDGSSIVDMNLATGTIVGIYGPGGFLGKTGRDQIASLIFVYGPQLTMTITCSDSVDGFMFDEEMGEFVLKQENIRMNASGKIWGFGNAAAVESGSNYNNFMGKMIGSGHAVRYSGGMVADVNQILLKGGGVFSYPGSAEKPQGKLRLAYECAPLSLLIERAGGEAVSDKENILDIALQEYHQRVPFFVGSKEEIEMVRSCFWS